MPGEVLASLASLLSAVTGRPELADKRLPGCWALELETDADEPANTSMKQLLQVLPGTHG